MWLPFIIKFPQPYKLNDAIRHSYVCVCHALSNDFESYNRLDTEPNVDYTLECTQSEQQ